MAEDSADISSIIRVADLVKRFDDKVVLDGVNLGVHAGETMVIMGGSGSGKSTLLRCMIGSIRPEKGSIELFGRDITCMAEDQINEVRKKFGILFQSGALFNSMSLRQNVALPLEEHTDLPINVIDIMVKIKLELVGLREHAEKFPSQISGGMKKRAGLARALALDPKILFYDEPTAGLDPVTSAEIDQLIIKLTKRLGVTSVVVTHEMDSAFTIADRMAILDKGRLLIVEEREYYDSLRRCEGGFWSPDAEAKSRLLTDDEKLIRQFLRGDPEGPITDRKQVTNYADDLLGESGPQVTPRASVQATR